MHVLVQSCGCVGEEIVVVVVVVVVGGGGGGVRVWVCVCARVCA